MTQQQQPVSRVTGTTHSFIVANPPDVDELCDGDRKLSLTIPRSALSPTAKCFGEMNFDMFKNALHYTHVIEIFLAIAYRAMQMDSSDGKRNVRLFMTRVIDEKEFTRDENDEVASLPPERVHDPTANQLDYTHVTLSLVILNDLIQPLSILEKLIQEVKDSKKRKKDDSDDEGDDESRALGTVWATRRSIGRFNSNKPLTVFVHDLTETSWRETIRYVNGLQSGYSLTASNNIRDDDSPFTPMVAFGHQAQWFRMNQSRVRSIPREYSSNVLSDEITNSFVFPFGGHYTYQVGIESWSPANWRTVIFPWCPKRQSRQMLESQALFARERSQLSESELINLVRGDPDRVFDEAELPDSFRSSLDLVRRNQPLVEDANRIFQWQVDLQAETKLELTETQWKEENALRFKRADDEWMKQQREMYPNNEDGDPDLSQAAHQNSESLRASLRRKAVLQSIVEFFKTVWQPTAQICPVAKACIDWFHAHLKKHGHFSFPRQRKHTNLSSYGDLLVAKSVAYETLFSVAHMHQDLMIISLAVLHNMLGSKFHFNLLLPGAAEKGKSFSLEKAIECLIKGTYETINKLTPAALTGMIGDPTKDPEALHTNDKRILFFDDIQPGILGMHTPNAPLVATDNHGNDMDAMIKSMQTSGEVNVSTMVLTDNGSRIKVVWNLTSRVTFFAGTNASPTAIQPAQATRWFIHSVEHERRNDRSSVSEKSDVKLTKSDKEARDRFIERARRNQCFACIIGMLIDGLGEFEPDLFGINTSAASHLLAWLTQEASQMNVLGNVMPRTKQQLEFLQMGAAMEDALDRHFDLITSPFCGKPWDPMDFIYLFRHLVTVQEHFTLAIGLMSTKFEDRATMLVERILYNWVRTQCVDQGRITADLQLSQGRSSVARAFDELKDQMSGDDFECIDIALIKADIASLEKRPRTPETITQLNKLKVDLEKLYQSNSSAYRSIPPPPPLIYSTAESGRRLYISCGGVTKFEGYQLSNPALFAKNHASTREELIQALALKLCQTSNDQVPLAQAIRALNALTQPTHRIKFFRLDSDDKIDPSTIDHDQGPRLQLNPFDITVALDDKFEDEIKEQGTDWVTSHRQTGQLESCVRKALSHRHSDGRDLIYGATVSGNPYQFSVMTIPRGSGKKKRRRSSDSVADEPVRFLRNYSYCPDHFRSILSNSMNDDVDESNVKESELDKDIDYAVVRDRWESNSTSDFERYMMPSPIPMECMLELFIAELPRKQLKTFPESFSTQTKIKPAPISHSRSIEFVKRQKLMTNMAKLSTRSTSVVQQPDQWTLFPTINEPIRDEIFQWQQGLKSITDYPSPWLSCQPSYRALAPCKKCHPPIDHLSSEAVRHTFESFIRLSRCSKAPLLLQEEEDEDVSMLEQSDSESESLLE